MKCLFCGDLLSFLHNKYLTNFLKLKTSFFIFAAAVVYSCHFLLLFFQTNLRVNYVKILRATCPLLPLYKTAGSGCYDIFSHSPLYLQFVISPVLRQCINYFFSHMLRKTKYA